VIVLDTHALIWWVTGTPRLSARAKRAIASAIRQEPVVASAISVFEIATLVRRGRLAFGITLEQWLDDVRRLPELRLEPVSADIAQLAGALPEPLPGDPADRIIVATAIKLQAKLVSADGRLGESRLVETIW
jgi:PIN domain nuclease of toxin-antitoxin system